MIRIARTLLAVAAGITLIASVAPAQAQPDGGRDGARRGGQRGGGGGWARRFEADFLRRDLTLLADELELDRGQRKIVETLLLDYESEFAELTDNMRERMTEMREGDDEDVERREKRQAIRDEMRAVRNEIRELRENTPEGEEIDEEMLDRVRDKMDGLRERMVEMRPQGEALVRRMEGFSSIFKDFRAGKKTLQIEFMANVQAVLSEPQVEQWPAFERTLRRNKAIGDTRLSGEGVDLVLVLRELNLSEDELWTMKADIDAYTIALDHALRQREAYTETSPDLIMEAMRTGDPEQARSIAGRETELRIAVRGVNELHTELLGASLTEHTAPERNDEFQRSIRRRAYGRIYAPTSMQRSFRVAKEFEELDEEVLIGIMALEESFTIDLETRNAELMRVTREYEPTRITDRYERFMAMRNGERRDRTRENPVTDSFNERTEMEKRYRQQLESMLTPEQIAQLPEPPRERSGRDERGWWGRGGGGGDDAAREQRRAERRQRMIQQFDADGDGELNDEEREKMRAAREARGGRGGRGGPGGGNRGGGGGGGRGGRGGP